MSPGRTAVYFFILLVLALWLVGISPVAWSQVHTAQVDLPSTPVPIRPPPLPEGEVDRDVKKLKKRRKSRSNKARKAAKKVKEKEKKIEEEKADLANPRPYQFSLGLSLVLPWVLASGKNESFTSDLSPIIHAFYRLSNDPKKKSGLLLGLRGAFFSGTGVSNGNPGRYGFAYFGPIIGYGKLPTTKQEFSSGAGKLEARNTKTPPGSGWLLLAGLTVRSKQTQTDHPADADSGIFSQGQGVDFAPPGYWLEFTYLTLYLKALGLQYTIGIQTDGDLLFPYLGVGVSGWH